MPNSFANTKKPGFLTDAYEDSDKMHMALKRKRMRMLDRLKGKSKNMEVLFPEKAKK